MKWIFASCLLLTGLLTGCTASSPVNIAPPSETVPSTQPDFSVPFAEAGQLYKQLEANTPIEVSPANATARKMLVTIPTLY